jgi:peptidoglycan-associated lipoprotein
MKQRIIAWTIGIATATLVFAVAGCQSTGRTGRGSSGIQGSEFRQASTASDSRSLPNTKPIAGLQTVYFEYDRIELRKDARSALKTNAKAIKKNEKWGTLTIEGHCDSRGSEEYNIALGEQRAQVVKRYLIDLGVPAKRMRVVSFGEIKPAVRGHNESAWRHNRRAEFGSES